MSVEIKVPVMGESISSAIIGQWLVQPGESVAQDTVLVILETDKVNLDVLAPVSGVLSTQAKKSGETAITGELLATMEAGAAPAPKAPEKPKPAATREPTPSAQRVLEEKKIDPATVKGTGRDGQILKEDVTAPAAPKAAPPVPAPPLREGSKPVEIVAMTPLRQTVARRLVEAQQAGALLTTFNEVDMTAVMDLRKAHQEEFQARHGAKLGFMSFFVKATVEALKAFPAVNAQVQGTNILYHNYYDIGVAVGGGKGLVVPVLRNAERLSFAEVEKQIKDYAVRAQASKLKLEELQGGTFTISNGGVYGSLLSTPIVNPPQSGVLGLHKIQDRPIALNGQVVIRPMMYLALTYDHRLVDGREAVSFLIRIKDCVENPTRILLEV